MSIFYQDTARHLKTGLDPGSGGKLILAVTCARQRLGRRALQRRFWIPFHCLSATKAPEDRRSPGHSPQWKTAVSGTS